VTEASQRMIDIQLTNQQTACDIEPDRLIAAAQAVLQGEGVSQAAVSLAVVDDGTIHALNRQYLQHDYPTDVLSFLLDESPESFSGEVIVSSDTAAAACSAYGWSAQDELLLYVIHGVLHLVGYNDHTREDRDAMRERERYYLKRFGLDASYDGPAQAADPDDSAGGSRP